VPEEIERLKAALADQYDVQRELGAGGMATVYLARDLKHDRLVALKVLHPDLAASLGAERFLREIRVTAKLSHPHILPLYDSGDADGLLYYVMPFVEGESLASKLEREKQLSIKETVQIVREVAEALAHAHSYGLVHRDIKPDNIMMSGGHAIVADFGIATAVSQAGGEKLTQTGMSIGTPAYMSPEQAMGEPVDARSDVYSLGCMLYEMLIGQIPFTGATPQQIIARHSMDHIPQPSILRDTIPEDLEEIIFRSMAKLPADRFRTAFEMAEALGEVDTSTTTTRRVPTGTTAQRRPKRRTWWQRAALPAGVALAVVVVAAGAWVVFTKMRGRGTAISTGPDARHIAVLYFKDLSPDTSLGYLADGLTEALINRLSTVPQLTVLSRDAVIPFRESNAPRDSIAGVLGVGSLVTGSVEPAGDRTRVTVRLVDGPSGSDIANRTFELPANNPLAVRDSAAEVVAGFLRRLGEEVSLRESRAGTKSVGAWILEQRAERSRKDAAALGTKHADQAMRLDEAADSLAALAEQADPRWTDPIVLRASIAHDQANLTQEPRDQASHLQAAVAHATRALGINPEDPEALQIRGWSLYDMYDRNLITDPTQQARALDSAQADLDKATKIDPHLANAWYALSQLEYAREDNVAATLAAERAYQEDAFLQYQNRNVYQLFQTHYDLEQFPNAQRWCDEGEKRFPQIQQFTLCQLMMLLTPWATPDPAKAWELVRRFDSLAAQHSYPEINKAIAHMFLGGALAQAGLADSARHVLVANRLSQAIDPDREVDVREAVARVILGDQDEAIKLLQQYVLANPHHKINTTRNIYWWWRPLRDNPKFQSVSASRQ
jgi:TolB-like protein